MLFLRRLGSSLGSREPDTWHICSIHIQICLGWGGPWRIPASAAVEKCLLLLWLSAPRFGHAGLHGNSNGQYARFATLEIEICRCAARPHLQHVHICNKGTSAASPKKLDFANTMFPFTYQATLRTEIGQMVSIAGRMHLERFKIKFIGHIWWPDS